MLKSKKKVAIVLNIALSELNEIKIDPNKYYYIHSPIDKNTGKKRKCECPSGKLKYIHKRLFSLLTRIEPPEYLHSGTKGRSYITNAKKHLDGARLIKMDIKRYFPSTRGWHVYQFFNDILGCSKDVSYLLTALTTYNDHLPTGSPVSQILAHYAHCRMFDQIQGIASSRGLVHTCYVDDIAMSGNKANKQTQYLVRGILKARGLSSPRKKERCFDIGKTKHITGAVIRNNKLFVPNRKHKKIHDVSNQINNSDNQMDKLKLINSNIGRVNAASELDERMKKSLGGMYQKKSELSKILQST